MLQKSLVGLVLLFLASPLFALPSVYFEKNGLSAGTTQYVLIDKSDTSSKFEHSDGTAGGDLYITSISGYIYDNVSAYIGFVTAIDASSATIRYYRVAVDSGTVVAGHEFSFLFSQDQNNSFAWEDGATANKCAAYATTDTGVQNDLAIPIYDTTTATPAVGDVILKLVVGAGVTSEKFNVLVTYWTKP